MASYDSIQANKLEIEVRPEHSRILANEFGTPDIDSSSVTQNTTTSQNTLDDSSTNILVNETQHRRQFFDRECVNLESHQLIFLYKNSNDAGQDETMFTLEELRKIVDYTKFINNVEQALQFIEQTKETTTFLVCSGSLDEIIVSQIHVLQNIRSIYIYCCDIQSHKQWSIDYTKVKDLYTDLRLLSNDLNHDVGQYLQQEKICIFSELGRENYTTNRFTFSWWNYFIFMLYNLVYPDSCCQTLVMTLRNYYRGKDPELKVLDEFERTYTPDTAVWWYTRDTFIYGLLNKALRQKIWKSFFCSDSL